MNSLLIEEPPLQVLPSLACKVGLNEAIILQQFHYWLQRSNNIQDGYKWIYNSYQEWSKQFPFWGRNTLIRAIHSLEKQGYLITGNYNKAGFDKTKWYRIDYQKLGEHNRVGKAFTQNGQTSYPKWVNGVTQNGQTNTNRLPETTTEITTHSKESELTHDFEELWKIYPNKKGKKNAFTAYKRAIKKGTTNKQIQDGIVNYKKQIKLRNTDSRYIAQGSTWFNQERWNDEYETGELGIDSKSEAERVKTNWIG